MLETLARDRIMVALDVDRTRALELADALAGHARWVKIGMTLYYAEGPAIVRAFKERGFKVFLDLKFHDIPHQVRGAARSAAATGADLLTVHGLGAGPMLAAACEGAREAAEACGGERARVIAITVLTSMDAPALASIGVGGPITDEAAGASRRSRATTAPTASSALPRRRRPCVNWVRMPDRHAWRAPGGAALGDQEPRGDTRRRHRRRGEPSCRRQAHHRGR